MRLNLVSSVDKWVFFLTKLLPSLQKSLSSEPFSRVLIGRGGVINLLETPTSVLAKLMRLNLVSYYVDEWAVFQAKLLFPSKIAVFQALYSRVLIGRGGVYKPSGDSLACLS
jgi:hypothetical protein